MGFMASFLVGLDPAVGFIITIVSAIAFELVENTELIINLFRENSGPSEKYKGDSKINVVGDILSCGLGYGASYIISRHLDAEIGPAIVWYIASEAFMTYNYR